MPALRTLLARVAVLVLVLLPWPSCRQAEADEDGTAVHRPNIVFLMADDQGWSGTSVAMHPDVAWSKSPIVQTPNLEKLAQAGMRFSNAYAPSPMCAPTRLALQTGKSPAALHWTKAGSSFRAQAGYKLVGPTQKRSFDAEHTSIAELLKGAGYRTAHFGKWHLGEPGPTKHGYDAGDGALGNEYAAKFPDPNPVDIFGMTDRAVEFMGAAAKAKKPFFVQMSYHALHAPENALQATKAKYANLMGNRGRERSINRAAIAEDLDTGVGKLLTALDALGLAGSTFVIYTSDNGSGGGQRRGNRRRGGASSGSLAGGKGSVGEGGIRVPFIIRGPGIEAGSVSHVPITGLDLYPTYASWSGLSKWPEGLEGGSLAGLLRAGGKGVVRRARPGLTFHFPHYQQDNAPQSAIRSGDLKLVRYYEDGRLALFDLSKDLQEQNDLAAKRPDDVKALQAALDAWLTTVKAQLPTKNAQHDPNKEPERRKRGGKGGRRR